MNATNLYSYDKFLTNFDIQFDTDGTPVTRTNELAKLMSMRDDRLHHHQPTTRVEQH